MPYVVAQVLCCAVVEQWCNLPTLQPEQTDGARYLAGSNCIATFVITVLGFRFLTSP